MLDFLSNNWLSIASIVIGVIVAYAFYRLQRKDSASATSERTKHASVELLDVIESYIINKQDLSLTLIDNLVHASERSYSVALRPACTAVTLLQDVALRLQRSRHLDIPQKTEYSLKLDELIAEVKIALQPLSWEKVRSNCSEYIDEIIQLVPDDRKSDVEEKLMTLSLVGDIAKNQGALNQLDEQNSKLNWVSVATAGIAAALAFSTAGTRLFLSVDAQAGLFTGRLISTLTIALIGALFLALGIYALRNYFRLLKKSPTRA